MTGKFMGRVAAATVVVGTLAVVVSPAAWGAQGNFGGYSATVVASASADITAPASGTLGCSSPKAARVESWVALTKGQYAANAGIVVACTKGSSVMYVAGAAGTVSFRFPVNASDVVSVSVSETSTATTVTAEDLNTTAGDTATSVGASITPTLVQFGATSITKQIPTMGSVTYSSVQVDGVSLTPGAATSRKLTRRHPPGVVAGPLSSGTFTLTEN